MLRSGDGDEQVTNVELFFDLVYVFAVTQLSHLLVRHTSVDGAIQTVVLLAMVWQVWVYTTWATNYLDPRLQSVRAMLLALMLGSLVLSLAIPDAFHGRGLLVASAYAAMQIGRCLFVVYALRGEQLQMTFWRILCWSAASSAVVLVGAAAHGHGRELLWAGAIAIDLIGGVLGFYTPGLGRSTTDEWTIEGGHFAERCQAFVLIALGESLVVTGTTLSGQHLSATKVVAFLTVFAGTVGLWWLYFDRSAEDSARAIETASDPGRLARDAFHWIHPLIVAGIIVAAAADEQVLADPTVRGRMSTAWLVLGGTALFLGGHALFKAVVWRVVPTSRLVAIAVLAVLLAVAPHVAAVVLSIAALAVIVAVAAVDRVQHPA
ncbi:MAG: Low temperature requirement protein LtrA [Pseudonocardiales bacterium]|nr:Low temperature requirement protein LtrA [Pseudonocardiales bacterium]